MCSQPSEIVQLRDLTFSKTLPDEDQNPSICLSHSSYLTPDFVMGIPRPWITKSNTASYFGVLVAGSDEPSPPSYINYYAMKPLNNQTDATLPSCLPLLMHSAVMDFCPEPGTMRFCDNYIIQPLLSPHSGVMLCTMTIPTTTLSRRHVEPLTEVQTLFWKPREAEEKISHFDFCPASGRLCVMTKKDVIHVVDYLLPIEGAYSVSISIIQRPDCQ